jgi:hypothetical protein
VAVAFPLDEIILGPRAYGLRKGTEMVVLHTTEGAGPTRANALATIKAQSPGGSLYAGGGSYHWVIYDGGAILTVPYLESAGSLTANHTPPPNGVWAPKAWVKGVLSAAAEADTNAYIMAICFSGKAADLAAGKYPVNMLDTAARLIRWIEQQTWAPDNINVGAHADFQTNRSDPGAGVVDKVLARYAAIFNPPPAPVTDYKALYEATRQKLYAANSTLTTVRSDLAAANARIEAAKAALA